MLSNIMKTSAVVLLSATMASAQTYSKCNPVKGQSCPADPAFGGKTITVDFTKGASDYFTLAEGTTLNYDAEKGAAFVIAAETNAPTITSNDYLFFGTVEVEVMAAPGTGIVTSFVLQSDDLDEIDWEWLGGDTTQVQTNYFSKGNTTTYNRGGYSSVDSPQTTFHTYTIDWSTSAVVWSIDGVTVRTLTYADANGGATFPQTPMQIKLGTWDGGASTQPKGTVEWAGGYTSFGSGSGAPYTGYYKSITITDRSNGVANAVSYSYEGTSGTYESIKVSTGSGSSSGGSSSSSTTTTSSATSSSKTSTSSSSSSTKTSSSSSTASSSTKASTTMTTSTASKASATTTMAATTGSSNMSASATQTPSHTSTGSATVATNGVAKVAANVVGAAGAVLAAFALL